MLMDLPVGVRALPFDLQWRAGRVDERVIAIDGLEAGQLGTIVEVDETWTRKTIVYAVQFDGQAGVKRYGGEWLRLVRELPISETAGR